MKTNDRDVIIVTGKRKSLNSQSNRTNITSFAGSKGGGRTGKSK